MARSAETAAETYSTDNGGSYEEVSVGSLKGVEDTIAESATESSSYLSGAGPIESNEGYEVTATSDKTGNTFTITRNANGNVSYTCTTGGNGGCPENEIWSD